MIYVPYHGLQSTGIIPCIFFDKMIIEGLELDPRQQFYYSRELFYNGQYHKAIDNFNLDLDVKFSTYAVPMCIGEIRRFLRDDNPVRVSRSMRDTAYKAMQIKEKLINENQKEPTVEEIAKELGMKKSDVVLALEAIVEPVSLYEPVYSDGGDTIYVMDQVGDSNCDTDWIDEIMIKDEINNLDSRERNILYLRFMQGKTQMEVAKEVGISQAQVSRLEKNA